MEPILEVKDLQMSFSSDLGNVECLDHISFNVDKGEILCIVGESGCGKSATALSIMGLLGKSGLVTGGEALFEGRDLVKMSEPELNQIRGDALTMIFQDAMTSLNPLFTVGNQMIEAIRIHQQFSKKEARTHAIHMLERVGLPNPQSMMKKYPYVLSGGMRQRVMIAMALCGHPRLLIADEPTTALDVTIQAQIVKLLKELRGELGLSVILITHDIGLVAEMADRVLVMYAGQVVEESDVFHLFQQPEHPYTRALMRSVPEAADDEDRRLTSIRGVVPEQYQNIKGCRFQDRCNFACEKCSQPQSPRSTGNSHAVRCWRSVSELDALEKDGQMPTVEEE